MTQYEERTKLEDARDRMVAAMLGFCRALERNGDVDLTDYPPNLPSLDELAAGLAEIRLDFPDRQLSTDQCGRIAAEMSLAAIGGQRGPVKSISTELFEDGRCMFTLYFSDDTHHTQVIDREGTVRDL